MRLAMSEILKRASETKNPKERVNFLRANWSIPFGQILRLTYDERIEFDLPEGAPPYKPSEYDVPTALYGEVKRMYLFVKGGNPNLKPVRRESLFKDLLEYVNAEDAKLIIAMKDHKQPAPYLTKKVIEEVFPGIMDIPIPGLK